MTKADIEAMLTKLNIPFGVVANVSTGEIERFGDPSSIQPADLINGLFGDIEAVRTLKDSFEGRLKPHSMGQGPVAAVLCTPTPDLVVGLFSKVSLGPVEYYSWAKRLCEDIDARWK